MQRLKNLHPDSILKKGFAILMSNGRIVTDPNKLQVSGELQAILKDKIIHSTITKKTKHEQPFDI